jgi:IS5 family transposase
MRRVWAPVGERPVARFKRGYKWTYLDGCVRPESGEVYWPILPTVNTKLFSMGLSRSSQRNLGNGAVRAFGLRQARYRGLKKAHLQELATATAANVVRIANWLNGIPTTARRRSRLAALAQAS